MGWLSCTRAYQRVGMLCAMATATLPTTCGAAGSPCPESCVHVSPPSRLTYMPPSGPPLSRFQGYTRTCHMPANSVLGSAGSMARSLQPVSPLGPSTSFHVLPPSSVR